MLYMVDILSDFGLSGNVNEWRKGDGDGLRVRATKYVQSYWDGNKLLNNFKQLTRDSPSWLDGIILSSSSGTYRTILLKREKYLPVKNA